MCAAVRVAVFVFVHSSGVLRKCQRSDNLNGRKLIAHYAGVQMCNQASAVVTQEDSSRTTHWQPAAGFM